MFVCVSCVVRGHWQRSAPMACAEHLPHFSVVQFVGLTESVAPWAQTPGSVGGWGVLLLCLHSWGWGGESVLCSFSFLTQPGAPPPLTQNLTMKGQEGGSPVNPHFEKWEELGFGGQIAQLSQPGSLVTTEVSGLKSERPRKACLPSCHCFQGDAGVALPRFTHHRAFRCV